ncbi:PREDICTED: uncharacterized protein LOC108375540, partial [Rhagoletis zephyria]|uniref:uncharacterized protein LOC108375540 n=1 Tax=Rhagoletis zephyria TaxID=28612 RepID=UPI0008114F6C
TCSVRHACRPVQGFCKRFEFPKTEVDRNEWALACKLQLPLPSTIKLFICERHFDKKFISTKRLLRGAFPVFHLTEDQKGKTEIQDNSVSSQWVMQPVTRTYCEPVQALETDLTFEEFALFSDVKYSNKNKYSEQQSPQIIQKKKTHSVAENIASDMPQKEEPIFAEERHAQICRAYQKREIKQMDQIKDLEAQIALLSKKYKDLEKRAIIASKQ